MHPHPPTNDPWQEQMENNLSSVAQHWRLKQSAILQQVFKHSPLVIMILGNSWSCSLYGGHCILIMEYHL